MINRQQIAEQLTSKGFTVQLCVDPGLIAMRVDVACPDPNERMRLTETGQLLTVIDGYYYQVGTVNDFEKYLRTLPETLPETKCH